jgi:hypothetical protein
LGGPLWLRLASDTRFHAQSLDVGVVLEDVGNRHRVVRMEQLPNPRACG